MVITFSYCVYVNNHLYTTKPTNKSAQRLVNELLAKGIVASWARTLEGK